ncbi:MAG TPA: hypothetical protein PKY25_02740 [Bacilli bacterium]|nr:hypothetical protein [Bacilli bacterium]
MDNENDLFPELDEIKYEEEKENKEEKNNFNDEENSEISNENEINLDIDIKKKKKEKIEYDPIMNPKKPKKKKDITIIFLVSILIIVIIAVYFGIKNDVININSIKTYFINQKVTCTKTNEPDTYSEEITHVFRYRFDLINYITSTYNYVSDDYIVLDSIAEYNNAVIANSIGYNGISYNSDISTTEYNIVARYNLSKINIDSVLTKNNDNPLNNDVSRVTLIDISKKMNIKSIILDYENQGYVCVK